MEKPNLYCHFAQGIGEPKYMPILQWKVITKLLQEALSSYNDLVAAMNLVLFEDAMMHICRYRKEIHFKVFFSINFNNFQKPISFCLFFQFK